MTATFYSSNGCSRSLPPPAPAAASPAISRLLRGSRGPGHRVLCGRVHTDRAGVAGSLPACGAPAGPAQLCQSRRLGGPGPAAQGPGDRARASPSAGSPSGLGAKGRGGVRSVPHHEGPPRGPSCLRTRGLLVGERGSAGDAGREAAAGAALGQGVWVSGSTLRDPAWRRRLFFKRPVSFRVFICSKSDALRLRSERPAPKSPRDAQGRCHTRLRSPTPGGLLPPPPAAPEPGLRAAEPGVGGDQGSPSAGRPGPGSSGTAGSPCVLPPPGSAEKTPEAGSGQRRAPALPPRGHARGGATAGLLRCGRRPPPLRVSYFRMFSDDEGQKKLAVFWRLPFGGLEEEETWGQRKEPRNGERQARAENDQEEAGKQGMEGRGAGRGAGRARQRFRSLGLGDHCSWFWGAPTFH